MIALYPFRTEQKVLQPGTDISTDGVAVMQRVNATICDPAFDEYKRFFVNPFTRMVTMTDARAKNNMLQDSTVTRERQAFLNGVVSSRKGRLVTVDVSLSLTNPESPSSLYHPRFRTVTRGRDARHVPYSQRGRTAKQVRMVSTMSRAQKYCHFILTDYFRPSAQISRDGQSSAFPPTDNLEYTFSDPSSMADHGEDVFAYLMRRHAIPGPLEC